jgi:predicted nucleic acid-binding protein
VIDTSVMVAGLVTNHELHAEARPRVAQAAEGAVPGLVVAETFARLRGYPFALDAATCVELLAPWADAARIVATPATAYATALGEAGSLNLGGNVHDLLVVLTCEHHGLPLATLDRRQHRLAHQRLGDAELLLQE